MRLTIIGMSNAGKTYWSMKLVSTGFRRFGVDEMIKEKLEEELKDTGFSGIEDVAKWMGQPYDERYPDTSKKYLDAETEAVKEILQQLENNSSSKENVVIDTTGSIIYTGDQIMKELAELTTVVHLHTPKSVQQKMYEAYLTNPKPVIWGSSFNVLNGESHHEALRRCYPKLLDFRTKRYPKYAHVTLDYFLLRQPDFTVWNFLQLIKTS